MKTSPIPRLTTEQRRRFWSRVRKTRGCWLWDGLKNKAGYGRVSFNRQYYLAHRIAWALLKGIDPGQRLGCHKCDTPACVRPHSKKHVFLGTQTENMSDASAKGRHWKLRNSTCPRGHAFIGANIYRMPGRKTRYCRACHTIHSRAYSQRHRKVTPRRRVA